LNKYKKRVYEDETYDPPQVILGRIKSLNEEIAVDLVKLEEMLG
jgi:type I restriction enzyme M protein